MRVSITKRYGDASALLSSEQHGMSSNMERVIKPQARTTSIPRHSYEFHRVFEHNLTHQFIVKLNRMVTFDEDSEEDFVTSHNAKELASLIHDIAFSNSVHNKNELHYLIRNGCS